MSYYSVVSEGKLDWVLTGNNMHNYFIVHAIHFTDSKILRTEVSSSPPWIRNHANGEWLFRKKTKAGKHNKQFKVNEMKIIHQPPHSTGTKLLTTTVLFLLD